MEDLLIVLLLAGTFYLMMRFSYHIQIQQHHYAHDSGREFAHKAVDPVCGKIHRTNQRYEKVHKGRLYHFCSKRCLNQFETNRDKYV